MKFTVNKTIRIYGKKQDGDLVPDGHELEYHDPTPASVSSVDSGWGEGPPDRDASIEDRKRREKWDKAPDFGELSISIQPGDERIGELYFNVQYEGPNHQDQRCVDGLNAALPNVQEWICQLLSDTTNPQTPEGKEVEIEMQVDQHPCPKGPTRIKAKLLAVREAKAAVIQARKRQHSVGRKETL